jgi:hypothetical protein
MIVEAVVTVVVTVILRVEAVVGVQQGVATLVLPL